jgi:hypothetical protein
MTIDYPGETVGAMDIRLVLPNSMANLAIQIATVKTGQSIDNLVVQRSQ